MDPLFPIWMGELDGRWAGGGYLFLSAPSRADGDATGVGFDRKRWVPHDWPDVGGVGMAGGHQGHMPGDGVGDTDEGRPSRLTPYSLAEHAELAAYCQHEAFDHLASPMRPGDEPVIARIHSSMAPYSFG